LELVGFLDRLAAQHFRAVVHDEELRLADPEVSQDFVQGTAGSAIFRWWHLYELAMSDE
jgi:hypothetical protein